MDVDVRNVETEYKPLLAMQAGREVDDGHEVQLSSVTVTVKVAYGRKRERYTTTYTVEFGVDHDEGRIQCSNVAYAYGDGDGDGVATERAFRAIGAADHSVAGLIGDLDVDLELRPAFELLADASDEARSVTVHTDLEVLD